jgi:hypothetical protein
MIAERAQYTRWIQNSTLSFLSNLSESRDEILFKGVDL